jgi:hypothetical protein
MRCVVGVASRGPNGKIKIKIINLMLRSMTSILFFPFDECFVCLLHECGVAAERFSRHDAGTSCRDSP